MSSAIQAIEYLRKPVRFLSDGALVKALGQEKAQGRAGKIATMLLKTDLTVLDKLGCLPFCTADGAMLFRILSKVYERTNVIDTINLNIREWPSVFGPSLGLYANHERAAGSKMTPAISTRRPSMSNFGDLQRQLLLQNELLNSEKKRKATTVLTNTTTLQT